MPVERIIDWTTIASILGVISIIVGFATICLRMMVSIEITKMKNELIGVITNSVYSKDLTDSRFNDVYGRLRFLEDWRKDQFK